MATVTERLAFLLTLDSSGAVKGFRDVGSTAEKELKKAEEGIDRTARSMVKFGAGASAFGVTSLVALGGLARMSEEANLQTVKLQNTLDNQPQLAGASAKAFTDLATAIQKKTAADGDDIVGAQAMLGQFGATQSQILTLTPLIVDLSRKMGIDLSTAATMVGKAIDGKATALARAGIAIDQTAFATDHYKAVVDGLRVTVGGFAETEGKTLEGRLQSLKNQLRDAGETAGGGAAQGFQNFLEPLTSLTTKLNDVNPAILQGAGQFAVYGGAALAAIGGISMLAGQAAKLSNQFWTVTETTEGTTRALNNYGRAAAGVAAVSTLALVYSLGKAKQAQDDQKEAAKAAGASTEDMAKQVADLADFAKTRFLPVMDAMRGHFDGIAKGGASIATLSRFRDAVAAAGYDTAYFDQKIADMTASQKQAAADSKTTAGIISELGDESEAAASKVAAVANALDYTSEAAKSTDNALRNLKSSTFDLADAQKSVDEGWAAIDEAAKGAGGATRDVEADMRRARNATEQLSDAQDALVKAQQRLEDVKKGPTARTVSDAELRVSEARLNAERASRGLSDAEKKLADARQKGTSSEVQGAELDLEDARIRARRASDEVKDAQQNLTDVRNVGKQGSKELAAAESELEAAQKRVRDATESVTDAQKAAQAPSGAHRDVTKAVADAYDQQVKNIWSTVEAMKQQGKSQTEIDAYVEASKKKLDEYGLKYDWLKGKVDAAKGALDQLNLTISGIANHGGDNLVPPANIAQKIYDDATNRTTSTSSANAAEYRARIVVPLYIDKVKLGEAMIDVDRTHN